MHFNNILVALAASILSAAAMPASSGLAARTPLTWEYTLSSAANCGGSSFSTSGFGVKVEPCIALVPPNNTPFAPVSLNFIEGVGETCTIGLYSSSTCSGTAINMVTGNFTCLTPGASSFSGISINCS